MDNLSVLYFALLFVVYPLLLVVAVMITKAIYASYSEHVRKQNHNEAMRRYNEQTRKIRERLNR